MKVNINFKNTKLYLIIGIIIIAFLAPLRLQADWVTFMILFFMYTAMAEVFNLLSGYSGILALGFYGFVGFGGYITTMASTLWGFSTVVSIIISGIACALLALATSFLISRMKGLYFAMGTLVTASVLFYWFQSWSYVGGGYGMPLATYATIYDLYYMSLVVALISIFTVYAFVRSRIGLRLKAIADDDMAAESYGVDVFKTKLLCWIVASFFAGISGSLYFIYSNFISPTAAFTMYWTLAAITAVNIGGSRTILGPIIGSLIVVWLRQAFLVQFPGISMLIYGILIVIVLLFFPQGIVGYINAFLAKQKKRKVGT